MHHTTASTPSADLRREPSVPEEQALRDMFSLMIGHLMSETRVSRAVIYVLDEKRRDLVCFDTFNIESKMKRPLKQIRFSVESNHVSLASHVWRTGKYKFIEKIERNSDQPVDPSVAIDLFGLEGCAVCGLPTRVNKDTAPNGVVVLFNEKNQEPLKEEEVRPLLDNFAQKVAVAIFMAQSSIRNHGALQDAYDQKMKFLRQVVHSFRTPVSSLKASIVNIDLLNRDPQRFKEHFSPMIVATAETLESLLREFETYATLQESGVGETTVEPIRGVVDEVISMVGLDPGDVKIHQRDESIEVRMNRDKVLRALVAITENATQYGKPPFEIFVETTGRTVDIIICDHGRGIPVEERGRAFEYGVRGTAGTQRPDGTGIGLAIAYLVAHVHNGELDFIDKEGMSGCCLRFALPIFDQIRN